MRRLLMCCVLLMMPSCVTLGPRTKTTFVMVRPGHPVEVLQNVTVTGRRLKDKTVGRVAIGGWVAMPSEHWELIEKKLGIE